MTEKINEFEQLIETAKLTKRMKIALQACLLGDSFNVDDYTYFYPQRAKEKCDLEPKGIGSIFAGINNRLEAIDAWQMEYTEWAPNPNRKKKIRVLIISNEIVSDAHIWAQNWDAASEPDDVKVSLKRGRPKKKADDYFNSEEAETIL